MIEVLVFQIAVCCWQNSSEFDMHGRGTDDIAGTILPHLELQEALAQTQDQKSRKELLLCGCNVAVIMFEFE